MRPQEPSPSLSGTSGTSESTDPPSAASMSDTVCLTLATWAFFTQSSADRHCRSSRLYPSTVRKKFSHTGIITPDLDGSLKSNT